MKTKTAIFILIFALGSTITFAQRTWITPEITADMEITDNTSPQNSYAVFYVDILTSDGNYSTWYASINPLATPLWGYGITNSETFQSTSTGINAWKPIPLPQNYYTLNFHIEKRAYPSGTLISRDNAYVYGILDANDNLYVNGKVNLELD